MQFTLHAQSPTVLVKFAQVGAEKLFSSAIEADEMPHVHIRNLLFIALNCGVNDQIDYPKSKGYLKQPRPIAGPVVVAVRMPPEVLVKIDQLVARANVGATHTTSRSRMIRKLVAKASGIPLSELDMARPGRPKGTRRIIACECPNCHRTFNHTI